MRRYCACYTARRFLTLLARCSACRERKVKCSGSQPCSACARRGDTCLFEGADQRKVTVSSSYLNRLLGKRKSTQREASGSDDGVGRSDSNRESEVERPGAMSSPSSAIALANSRNVPSHSSTPARSPDCAESHTNPLVGDSTRYLAGDDGRKSVFNMSSLFPLPSLLIKHRVSRTNFVLEFQFAGMADHE
jgi:hypothetical protein